MFNELNCLVNLKHIITEHADDENMKNLSLDELRPSYMELADILYPLSVSNRLKYKNMLWHIDNLKPEIRSDFQAQLFDTWYSIYIKSIKTDQAKDLQEMKKQEPTHVVEPEKKPDVDVKEQKPVFTEQPPIENKRQKRDILIEDTDLNREVAPVKKLSHPTPSKASTRQFENDWFDKFLDFFAVIVGGMAGMFGR
jgi:hypothetical protein